MNEAKVETTDIAKYKNVDGNLNFLGKIRGY
jgi:hypothetical protein